MSRFELEASWTPFKRDTKLRHTRIFTCRSSQLDYNSTGLSILQPLIPIFFLFFAFSFCWQMMQNMVLLYLRLGWARFYTRRGGWVVESTGLENRRCESIRGFESHPLRQANFIQSSAMQKYPSGRRGSPAKGVGGLETRARVQIPPSAPGTKLVITTVTSFFLCPFPSVFP